MPSVYTDGIITITKDSIFGWSVLIADNDNQQSFKAFDDLDNDTMKMVKQRLTNSIFPQEARDHMEILVNVRTDERGFRLSVINSQENWDILDKCGVYWIADNETLTTMDVLTMSESSMEIVKMALNASSYPYPAPGVI